MENYRRIILLLALTFVTGLSLTAARQNPGIKGRVLDESGTPLEFATAVLLNADSIQQTGAVTGRDGIFSLVAPKGDYILKVFYLGYKEIATSVELRQNVDMGDMVMLADATQMDAVVVKARPIVREADRFVVNVANNPVAIGKDAFEMLKASPAIWISANGGITINGRSGTRILINERPLRMSGDELEAYLKTINAEDILKIEILPEAGVDYDADSRGGVIKITLKKRRTDGMEGSVRIYADRNATGGGYTRPSFSLNYQKNGLNLYTTLGYVNNIQTNSADETVVYGDGMETWSETFIKHRENRMDGKAGLVYDINKRHSIGGEFNFYNSKDVEVTDGTSRLTSGALHEDVISHYEASEKYDSYWGALNYIYKMDTIGSSFKLIADYSRRKGTNPMDYLDTRKVTGNDAPAGTQEDISRSRTRTDYSIFSATAAFEIMTKRGSMIRTGAKFTHNGLYSSSVYEDLVGGLWMKNPRSSVTDYTENIAALYAAYNVRLGKIALSAGVRGEYTQLRPSVKMDADGQGMEDSDYFSLFPNFNLSIPMHEEKGHSIILSYSRNISRPGFWQLNPTRIQLSPTSYIIGNPDLLPTYANNMSVTTVFAHKYSLSFTGQLNQNNVMQMAVEDDEDTSVIYYVWENVPRDWTFTANANIPVTITKWWTANLNLMVSRVSQQIGPGEPFKRKTVLGGYASMVFDLPLEFILETSYWYNSSMIMANMVMEPQHNANIELKKRFFDNKFTVSIGMDNIFNTDDQYITSTGEGFRKHAYLPNFDRRCFNVSLRYNFNSGNKIKSRQVERASREDASRMGSN